VSKLIAIDPNLLLGATQRNRHCESLLGDILDDSPQFCLALDWDRSIFDAYLEIEGVLMVSEITKTFIEQFLLERAKRQRVRDTVLSAPQRAELAVSFGIDEPVEPELVTVGVNAGHGVAVLVAGEPVRCEGARRRATDSPGVIDRLHRQYGSLCIWRASEARKAIASMRRSRHPDDEPQLEDYVKGGEDEFVEYKQPATGAGVHRQYSTCLSQSIIIDALKAASGMINTAHGRVFIGITPDKIILGIDPPSWTATGEPDDDGLSRRFTDQFDRFEPCVNQYIKPSVVPLGSGRRVVVLHVDRGGSGVRYTFNDNETISVYDRCGPSTRRTEVLHWLRPPR
jgi:hypothetical protein